MKEAGETRREVEEARDSEVGPSAGAQGAEEQSKKRKSKREQEIEMLKAQIEEKAKQAEESYDRFLSWPVSVSGKEESDPPSAYLAECGESCF